MTSQQLAPQRKEELAEGRRESSPKKMGGNEAGSVADLINNPGGSSSRRCVLGNLSLYIFIWIGHETGVVLAVQLMELGKSGPCPRGPYLLVEDADI